MPIANLMKLFRSEGREIKFLRASTLGHYWYCAVQAWLQARGTESPTSDAISIGKRIHNEIAEARALSPHEAEFEKFITSMMVEKHAGEGSTGLRADVHKVFMRAWRDGETIIGHVVTHGVDDFRVFPDRHVAFIEYKTTAQRVIDYYKLSPATFQLKVCMWIFEPYLTIGGYTLANGEIVFLNRRGQPLGRKEVVDYSVSDVEQNIAKILAQFRSPETLIPPAKWKCLRCPAVFKEKCPFVKKEDNHAEKQE